jgi:UDP:flavonoid glycosyltransferase YjiC (YdhE family)
MLVLPQGADQWHNAERVVASGAGRRLLRGQLSAAAVNEELTELLSNPSYRRNAAKIQNEIGDMPPVAEAVRRMETLL